VTNGTYQVALGRKIAECRRQRGLSQPQLARLIDRSVAWVSQVERGVRRVDRMSVLETIAAALDTPLAELAAEAPVVAAVAAASPDASDLRLVLSGAHALQAMLHASPAPDLAGLPSQVDHAWALTHAGRYGELTELLHVLLPDLESAARTVPEPDRSAAFALLAGAYQACSAALVKLGQPEAAWVAVDRAMHAAEQAGDPYLVAAAAFRLVFVFLNARHDDQAEETARTATEALSRVADPGNPAALSLWGALTLQRALIAARGGHAEAAYRLIAEAGQAAGRLGPGRNDYNTEFGPVNVEVHEVHVAVELGDAGRAIRAAERISTETLSPERRARMLIDVARAHAQRRQVADAVDTLLRAEGLTPEQVRSHPVVRQTVADLLLMQDPPGPGLRALSTRIAPTSR
jgi:transcriptional regulator with XRE-family HTH domain